MRKVKAFYAPDGVEEYFGFFSIKEDANFFYGYKMSKEPGTYSIILQHGTRKNPDDIYIICDYMCKISKSIRLNRMILDYDIYALRDLTDSLKMNVACKMPICKSAKRCKLNEHLTPEQFAARCNPELRSELRKLKEREAVAALVNDKDALKKISARIRQITYEMGYTEKASNNRHSTLLNCVKNTKAIQGGGCSHK